MRLGIVLAFVAISMAGTFGTAAHAANCDAYPYTTLSNGTTADATQVMGNFNSILNCANTALAPLAYPSFTGNVGIGTTTPGAKLAIQSDTAGQTLNINDVSGIGADLRFFENGTYIGSFGEAGTNGAFGTGVSTNDMVIYSGTGSNNINFVTNNANATFASRMIITPAGNVGIGTLSPSYPLMVNGTAYATGAAGALSDRRHKSDIEPFPDSAVSLVMRLKPVTFSWKDPRDDGMRGRQIGFIAQDVQPVLPDVVLKMSDAAGTLGLKYDQFIPVLAKAVQEQQAEIADLKIKVAQDARALTSALRTVASLATQMRSLRAEIASKRRTTRVRTASSNNPASNTAP
ncbi:MAG: tail fiber domain-containing protein [Rhizomicrobium sp.]